MTPTRPVYVAGAAAVSAHGLCWRELGTAVAAGRSALAPAAALAPSHGCVIGAQVAPLPPQLDVEPRTRKLMSRPAHLGTVALGLALSDAGWADDDLSCCGLYMGVGASGGAMDELGAMLDASIADRRFELQRFGQAGLAACNPLFAFQLMNNFSLCHAAIRCGVGGPNSAFFSRGTGTLEALAQAVAQVASGQVTQALAGGTDSALHPVTWDALQRDGSAAQGLVPGEAAALLALGSRAEGALAALEHIAYRSASACTNEPAAVLRQLLAEAQADATDLFVLAPWGHAARQWLCNALPASGIDAAMDTAALLGDALAAAPALAWTVALQRLQQRMHRRALVLSAGVDGGVGVVALRAIPSRPAAAAATVVSLPAGARRHAVITGVGAVSAFGVGLPALLQGLAAGRSAIGPIRSFDATALPVQVAGEVPVALPDAAWMQAHAGNAAAALAPHAAAWRDRKVAFAVLAALEAWQMAACGAAEQDGTLVLGLGLERAFLEDFAPLVRAGRIAWQAPAPATAHGAYRFRSEVDAAARLITQLLGLRGACIVNASACAAGGLALAHAAALIESGAAPLVLCGGADSMVNPFGLGGMARLGAPSPRHANDACRPFDLRRDGLVIGEGAAVFVLESSERARQRGAEPLAWVRGHGSSQDAYRATAPRPDGAAAQRAMRQALQHAGLAPAQVGYINAHGTGTALNDVAEARALRAVFGAHADTVPVSSIKGAVGHLMAAAGAIEAAACLLALRYDRLPGTAHHVLRDPQCDLNIIGPTALQARVDHVLSNSFGFGGQNVALVLSRCDGGMP